jgi:hypothetical protein
MPLMLPPRLCCIRLRLSIAGERPVSFGCCAEFADGRISKSTLTQPLLVVFILPRDFGTLFTVTVMAYTPTGRALNAYCPFASVLVITGVAFVSKRSARIPASAKGLPSGPVTVP